MKPTTTLILDRNSRFLDPRMHPGQIIHALHSYVSVLKAQMRMPAATITLQTACTVVVNKPWNIDKMTKSFGLVQNCYIPCVLRIIKDGVRDWCTLDVELFDAYYGPFSAYTAIMEYARAGMEAPDLFSVEVAEAITEGIASRALAQASHPLPEVHPKATVAALTMVLQAAGVAPDAASGAVADLCKQVLSRKPGIIAPDEDPWEAIRDVQVAAYNKTQQAAVAAKVTHFRDVGKLLATVDLEPPAPYLFEEASKLPAIPGAPLPENARRGETASREKANASGASPTTLNNLNYLAKSLVSPEEAAAIVTQDRPVSYILKQLDAQVQKKEQEEKSKSTEESLSKSFLALFEID